MRTLTLGLLLVAAMASAVQPSPIKPSLTSRLVAPHWTANSLDDVVCWSPRRCLAVGSDSSVEQGSQIYQPLTAIWNGSSWRRVAAPVLPAGTSGGFADLSCPTRTACFSAISYYSLGDGRGHAAVWKFDGTRWTDLHLRDAHPRAEDETAAVSCPNATTCLAVVNWQTLNDRRTAYGERWNGHRWTMVQVPAPRRAHGTEVDSIVCRTRNFCMAVGAAVENGSFATLAGVWNGRRWRLLSTPTPSGRPDNTLESVSCTSSRHCVAVGQHRDSRDRTRTLIEKWNGRRWQIVPAPGVFGALFGIGCRTATYCIAVGASPAQAIAERWNGTAWKALHTPHPRAAYSSQLRRVTCPSSRWCLSVGQYVPGSNRQAELPLVAAWNGTRWHRLAPP